MTQKVEAIEKLGFGVMDKIFLAFDKVFWDQVRDCGIFWDQVRYCGISWDQVRYCKIFWDQVRYCGFFWDQVRCS